MLLLQDLKTAVEQVHLHVHLLALLLHRLFLLHDGLEKRTFGEFAATGVFRFFGVVAHRPSSSLFFEEVGFDHVADLLLARTRRRLVQQLLIHQLYYTHPRVLIDL